MGELIPIIAIIATACVIIAFLNRGHAPKASGSQEENVRLVRENEVLHSTVERLEERIAVLERIATDPAERTAREIESLR